MKNNNYFTINVKVNGNEESIGYFYNLDDCANKCVDVIKEYQPFLNQNDSDMIVNKEEKFLYEKEHDKNSVFYKCKCMWEGELLHSTTDKTTHSYDKMTDENGDRISNCNYCNRESLLKHIIENKHYIPSKNANFNIKMAHSFLF